MKKIKIIVGATLLAVMIIGGIWSLRGPRDAAVLAPDALPPVVPALLRADMTHRLAGPAAPQEERALAAGALPVAQAGAGSRTAEPAVRARHLHGIEGHGRIVTPGQAAEKTCDPAVMTP